MDQGQTTELSSFPVFESLDQALSDARLRCAGLDGDGAAEIFQGLLEFVAPAHTQGAFVFYPDDCAFVDQCFECDFTIAWVRIKQDQNLITQGREIVVLRCAKHQELVASDRRVDALPRVDYDRRWIVFAYLQPPDNDCRAFGVKRRQSTDDHSRPGA